MFYFTFSDSSNNTFRSPSSGEYKFKYGSDIISLNLQVQIPINNSIVSDFYPNPFIPANHYYTSFNYYTSGNEMLRVLIIDGAGQKVKEVITTTPANIGLLSFRMGWLFRTRVSLCKRSLLCFNSAWWKRVR